MVGAAIVLVVNVSGSVTYSMDATGVCSQDPATMNVEMDYDTRIWSDGRVAFRERIRSEAVDDASGEVLGHGVGSQNTEAKPLPTNSSIHFVFTCKDGGGATHWICGYHADKDGNVTFRDGCD